jgi:predicted transcriptional regulator of viral defense system
MNILTYLNTVESATLQELYDISDYNYYLNWQKHFGQVMSRLVKQGKVVRIKKGVFRIAKHNEFKVSSEVEIENQIKLF